jgi:hypothetical protein
MLAPAAARCPAPTLGQIQGEVARCARAWHLAIGRTRC